MIEFKSRCSDTPPVKTNNEIKEREVSFYYIFSIFLNLVVKCEESQESV